MLVQAAALAALCNGLLDTQLVRSEINAREAAGQYIAGERGQGGVYPMRSAESRAKRSAAPVSGQVSPAVNSAAREQLES